MKAIPLKRILEKHIVPMFTGSTLSEHQENRAWTYRRAFLRNVSEMVVRAAQGTNDHFLLRRSQPFDQSDADFVECFVEHLHRVGDKIDETFVDDLINPILRRSVAERVNPGWHTIKNSQGAKIRETLPDISILVAKVISQFEGWADQTYEGRKIAAAVGIDASVTTSTGVNVLDVFSRQFGVVLANGLETFIKVGSTGDVFGHEPMGNTPTNTNLLAPLRFCRLAEWATRPRIGIGLTRNGEILIFAGKSLVFAKRRGVWHLFSRDALLKRMSLRNCFSKRLCRAVFQTCLDISFAKTGGGIVLVKRQEYEQLLSTQIISQSDFLSASNPKSRCLNTIIAGQPFHALDRHLRHDIAAIDGATILDYHGVVIAAGAIVRLAGAGSQDGGARKAAAKTMSRFGLAIKVSSDGEISGFKSGDANAQNVVQPEQIFSLG
jgi:hypothetical protein